MEDVVPSEIVDLRCPYYDSNQPRRRRGCGLSTTYSEHKLSSAHSRWFFGGSTPGKTPNAPPSDGNRLGRVRQECGTQHSVVRVVGSTSTLWTTDPQLERPTPPRIRHNSNEDAVRLRSALPASTSSYLTPSFMDHAAARRTGEGCPARRTRRSTTVRSQASGFLYVTGVSRSFSFYWIGSQSVSFYI